MNSSNSRATNVGAVFGHDAPVFYRSDDFYNRWPVANAISRSIAASPDQWSTRIGLYGRWGEGKTSVLNFIEKQQRDRGNLVVRYAPWGASSEDELWRTFSDALRLGLKKGRAETVSFAHGRYLWRRYASQIAGAVTFGGKAANLKAPGASVATDYAASLITKHLKVTRRDIEAMTELIGHRRIVVLIDDLDRADPKIVPKLLLALRDLLDIAKFCFVLAFDKDVVTKALASHNQAWAGGTEDFLHKIIDFPFELPAPTRSQVESLAEDQFAKLCPFVPSSSLAAVKKVLPSNPRKLKLLGRVLANSREEADRHEQGEINWEVAILYALMRLESEGMASEVLEMSIEEGTGGSEWVKRALMEKAEREEAKAKDLKGMIARHSLANVEGRVKDLVEAWSNAVPYTLAEGLRYHVTFGVSPHNLTWGEFKSFLAEWRSDKQATRIRQFLGGVVKKRDQPIELVAYEFGEALISYYANVLESAANVTSRDAHVALTEEAIDVLGLLRQVLIERTVEAYSESALFDFWKRIHWLSLQWVHFNANEREPELRAAETAFLSDLAASLADSLRLYEVLRPWVAKEPILGERVKKLQEDHTRALTSIVEPRAVEAVLDMLRTPKGVRSLRSKNEDIAVRYLLCATKSPLFLPDRKKDLLDAISGRSGTVNEIEDGLDYLGAVLGAIPHGDGLDDGMTRSTFLLRNVDFVALVWGMCVSGPSQFRGLEALRGRHKALLDIGIPASSLSMPDWLK